MKRGVMAALAVLMVLPGAQAFGQVEEGRIFGCGYDTNVGSEWVRERYEGLIVFVFGQYRLRWDARYMREQCEAFANGEPHDISCLQGKRDWEEIESMVPDKFFEMGRMDFAEPLSKLRDERPIEEAQAYCRSVGAIE